MYLIFQKYCGKKSGMGHNIKQLRMVYNVFNIPEILRKEIWYGPQYQAVTYGIKCFLIFQKYCGKKSGMGHNISGKKSGMGQNIKQLCMVYIVFNISEILWKEIWYGPQYQAVAYGIQCS